MRSVVPALIQGGEWHPLDIAIIASEASLRRGAKPLRNSECAARNALAGGAAALRENEKKLRRIP